MLMVRRSVLLTGFPLFLTIIDLPQRYQIVDDKSSTSAGIRLMPLLFSSAFGSTFGGLCNRRKNTTFYTLTAASCLMLIGCGLLSTAPVNTSIEPSLYGFQVVFGVGLGMTFSTATIIATMESKYADYGMFTLHAYTAGKQFEDHQFTDNSQLSPSEP